MRISTPTINLLVIYTVLMTLIGIVVSEQFNLRFMSLSFIGWLVIAICTLTLLEERT